MFLRHRRGGEWWVQSFQGEKMWIFLLQYFSQDAGVFGIAVMACEAVLVLVSPGGSSVTWTKSTHLKQSTSRTKRIQQWLGLDVHSPRFTVLGRADRRAGPTGLAPCTRFEGG